MSTDDTSIDTNAMWRQLDEAVVQIVAALNEAQNDDLLEEVINLGDGSSEESFMWGFTYSEHSDHAKLDRAQTERFDAIVDPLAETWSGFIYGQVLRRVQGVLRQERENNSGN